jgi:hypothetical protein
MKKVLFLLLFLATSLGFSQSVNDYKYAIVPSKFEFLKNKDQYRLNTLTKLLMEKYGFVTYFDTDILPVEVAETNCNKVFVEVQSTGNLFSTKITVVLKDCKNAVLFTTSIGKSKEKEYQVAYNQALREAFSSFDKLGYKYNESSNINENNNSNISVKSSNFVNESDDKSNVVALFAQPIENGFQIIDTTPKVLLKIYKTSIPSCFIAYKDTIQGVLVNKCKQWFFEYFSNSKVISEKMEIKF